MIKKFLIILSFLFILIPELSPATNIKYETDRLVLFMDEWVGTPYRYGGVSKKGIDCSGLIRELIRDVYNRNLPRSAYLQYKSIKPVQKKDLKKGDLVFFKTGGFNPWHVGMYIGSDMFLHSSSSLGVTVSCLTDARYQRIYYAAGRIMSIT